MGARVDGALFHTVMQTSGIEQGIVFGSLRFILQINDLPSPLKHCTVKLYADDLKVYFHFTPNLWMDSLQRDLDVIIKWANEWLLSIAIDKTFMLHLRSVPIAAVDSVKNLGVYIFKNFSWRTHITLMSKRAIEYVTLFYVNFTRIM